MSLYESLNRAVTEPTAANHSTLLNDLCRILRALLRRRRILEQSPNILGLGMHGMLRDDLAVGELAMEMLCALLLDKLGYFRAVHAQHGTVVADRYMVAAMRHHIHFLQSKHDQLGIRVYRWCVQTVERALLDRLIQQWPEEMPLCSETLLQVSRAREQGANEQMLLAAVENGRLADEVSAAIAGSTRFDATFILHSAHALQRLPEVSCEAGAAGCFRFGMLVRVMQTAVRARQPAALTQTTIADIEHATSEAKERQRYEETCAHLRTAIRSSTLKPLQKYNVELLFDELCLRTEAGEETGLRTLASALQLPVATMQANWERLRKIVDEEAQKGCVVQVLL